MNKFYQSPSFLLVPILIFLSPIIFSGFYADDMYNSLINGSLMYTDMSLWERIIAESKGWIFGSGRLFIFNWIYIYSTYFYIHSVLIIKLICFFIVSINCFLFLKIIHYLSKEKKLNSQIYLTIILSYLLSVQFSKEYDPILAFTFLIPMITLLNFLSVFLLLKFKNNFIFYLISLILFSISLVTYELAFIFAPIVILIIIAIHGNNKNGYLFASPFLLVSFALFALIIYLKTFVIQSEIHPDGTYPNANFNLNLDMLNSFVIQSISNFPFIQHFKYFGLTLLSLFAFSYYKIYRNNHEIIIAHNGFFIVGLLLIFLPAAIVSMSGHQDYLISRGIGGSYLSSYIQSFGVAIVLAPLLRKLLSLKYGLVVISLLVIINFGFNIKVVKSLNSSFKYPRQILVDASNAGIFDNFNDGTYIFRYMRQPSDYFWHYAQLSHKKIKTCELANINQKKIDATFNYIDCLSDMKASFSNDSNGNKIFDLKNIDAYVSNYILDKYGYGIFYIAKVDEVTINENDSKIISLKSSELKIFDSKSKKLFNKNVEQTNLFPFLEIARMKDYYKLDKDEKSYFEI